MSPSPSGAPPVGAQSYSFATTSEGWTFANPSPFSTVTGAYSGATTTLDQTTSDNTNSFAYWESPVSSLANGTTGASSLYRTTFTVKSNLADLATVPAIRIRSSSLNFEQSDSLVISSAGDGEVSPPIGGRTYSQFFSQPSGVTQFRLDLDVLNFDPTDAANATLSLDNVVVEALALPGENTGQVIASYDFATDGPGTFTPRDASPTLTRPEQYTFSNGLSIRGTTNLTSSNDTIFGFWGAETLTPMFGNAFYALTFTVRSTATDVDANKAQIPVFRFRVNDSTLKVAAVLNIDSRDGMGRLPVGNAQESYTLYFQPPLESTGSTFVISFDYLYAPEAADNPNIAVILDTLTIRQYLAPGF
ncbi:MAG: hypothetical protein ABI579_08925 [Candidatus Sumerlaeota bacterium]